MIDSSTAAVMGRADLRPNTKLVYLYQRWAQQHGHSTSLRAVAKALGLAVSTVQRARHQIRTGIPKKQPRHQKS